MYIRPVGAPTFGRTFDHVCSHIPCFQTTHTGANKQATVEMCARTQALRVAMVKHNFKQKLAQPQEVGIGLEYDFDFECECEFALHPNLC